MRLGFATLTLAMFLGAAAPATAASADVEGLWLTEKKKVGVALYSCGERLCGRIAWLADPRWSDGSLRLDERNPDPALRDRRWCGIEVISGLKQDGKAWEKGSFYYPKDGKTYDIEMEPQGDGTLRVRAYLGVKLLGKTETWTRPQDELPVCEVES